MKSLLIVLLIALQATVSAAEGDPIAIRMWEDKTVSIETHSGLNLGVLPSSSSTSDRVPAHRVDQSVHAMNDFDHVLFREVNQSDPVFRERKEDEAVAQNSIIVRSEHPSDTKLARGMRIEVDGVSIVVALDLGKQSKSLDWQVEPADVFVVPELTSDGSPTLSNPVIISYFEALKPRQLVVSSKIQKQDMDLFSTTTGIMGKSIEVEHNTFAVSMAGIRNEDSPRLMTLGDSPKKLSDELERLFKAMELSNLKSQRVFEKLSAKQLNFKPANGTHTPRWNSEHMMGRQLLFFSQIYHAVDPTIPVMNLNPKQMPRDYAAAHPDWDGKEEARQMQRVSDFTRRYAYLLEGIELNKRAPGSGWTLAALLRQMDRHYGDHTANTVKKFELPGWPSE
ncbi:MAG: DinB family protein [Planctomycetota bacterium]